MAEAAWLCDVFNPLRVKQHRAPRWAQRSPCHPSFWPFSSHLSSKTGLPSSVWRVTLYKVRIISKRCIIQQRKTERNIYINNSIRLLKGYTELLVFCPEFLFFKKNYSTVRLNYFNYGLQNRDGNVISAVLSVTITCKTPSARSLLRLHFKKLCQKNLHHTHACVICDFADRIQFYVDLFLY